VPTIYLRSRGGYGACPPLPPCASRSPSRPRWLQPGSRAARLRLSPRAPSRPRPTGSQPAPAPGSRAWAPRRPARIASMSSRARLRRPCAWHRRCCGHAGEKLRPRRTAPTMPRARSTKPSSSCSSEAIAGGLARRPCARAGAGAACDPVGRGRDARAVKDERRRREILAAANVAREGDLAAQGGKGGIARTHRGLRR